MKSHDISPEVVIGGHISLMISEHCPIGDIGLCSQKGEYFLKDRKGEFFPLMSDCISCRSMTLAHKTLDNGRKTEEYMEKGIFNFRIYG